MAVNNTKIIDGIGTNKEQDVILLLLCDHIPWDSEEAPKHSDHLLMLQRKINTYVAFLEKRQYKEKYPNLDPKMAIIDIRFQYEIPETCKQFIENVQEQLDDLRIKLEVHIG